MWVRQPSDLSQALKLTRTLSDNWVSTPPGILRSKRVRVAPIPLAYLGRAICLQRLGREARDLYIELPMSEESHSAEVRLGKHSFEPTLYDGVAGRMAVPLSKSTARSVDSSITEVGT